MSFAEEWAADAARVKKTQDRIDAAEAARAEDKAKPRVIKQGGGGGAGSAKDMAGGPTSLADLGMLGSLLMHGINFGHGVNSLSGAFGNNAGANAAASADEQVYSGQQEVMKKRLADALNPSAPAGPSRGAGYGMGGAPQQWQPVHQSPMQQKFEQRNEERYQDNRSLGMQQRQGNMKSKLAQQLLQSILGTGLGRHLNDPQVRTEDTQALGERGGVSVRMPIHTTETQTPGGQGRAQMMAQLLQAIQGMV